MQFDDPSGLAPWLTNRRTRQIRRMKFAEDLEGGTIEDRYLVTIHGDQSVSLQLGEHAIDVGPLSPTTSPIPSCDSGMTKEFSEALPMA